MVEECCGPLETIFSNPEYRKSRLLEAVTCIEAGCAKIVDMSSTKQWEVLRLLCSLKLLDVHSSMGRSSGISA